MNLETEKSVVVIDESLSVGIIAKTAAILDMTLVKRMPENLTLTRQSKRPLKYQE